MRGAIQKKLILIPLLLATMSIKAQNAAYTYDNAGNRTARTTVVLKSYQIVDNQQTITEIPNPVSEKDILVYPNPTQGHFTVDITNVTHDNLKGEANLFDANGKLLDKKNIHSHSAHKKLNFDLTHKARGTYLLNVSMGDNTFTWKIIKK